MPRPACGAHPRSLRAQAPSTPGCARTNPRPVRTRCGLHLAVDVRLSSSDTPIAFSQTNSNGNCQISARFMVSWEVETGRDRAGAQALVGQRDAGGQAQSTGNDRIAAEETRLAIENVHRAAAAAALQLAEHLGQLRTHRPAARGPKRSKRYSGKNNEGRVHCWLPTAWLRMLFFADQIMRWACSFGSLRISCCQGHQFVSAGTKSTSCVG